MEFFIPGLLLFLVSIIVAFLVIPRFTPLIVAILSIAFLSYGIYDHYTTFASEYRLSTWQEPLKVYAPAIMIITILIYIIYTILAFFTSGSVPVPAVPNIIEANQSSATNQIVKSLNKITNVFTNNTNNKNTKNESVLNQVTNTLNNTMNTVTNSLGLTNNTKRNNNKTSRSFVETF